MDNLSDQIQSKVFQNLVDLADFQNCRLVSQKWRRNVVTACRNKFHVVFPLTDSTLFTANQLKDALVSFDVFSFTGKESEDAWATSGIEPLMQTTEWLQFTGNEVDTEQIRKFLGLANDSLKTLSFICLKKDLTSPFREMQENFGALRKLSIGYHSHHSTFGTVAKSLEKWNSLDCRVQLPRLESLHLNFDCKWGYNFMSIRNVADEFFRNYIAIAKLLLKYKQTLREVQIERVLRFHSTFNSGLVKPGAEWAEMERGLEALDDLNLNRLKITTKPAYHISNRDVNYNYVSNGISIEVLGRPKNLKNVLYNNLMCPNYRWLVLFATLPSHADDSNLTSIKISLSLVQSHLHRDPTLAVNFGVLQKCTNLKTLWLMVDSWYRVADLFVRNVELLPKGISILRLESPENDRGVMGQEILLSQQQIRWIIDNLRELESFWMSLVIPEVINANENNEQREDAGAVDDEDEDFDEFGDIVQPPQPQPQQQVDVNRLANINLDTFRDLLAMPNLKDLKVNMMKSRALLFVAGHHHLAAGQGQGTTLDVIREYSDLCVAAGYAATTTTSRPFGADFPWGFATLAIQKKP